MRRSFAGLLLLTLAACTAPAPGEIPTFPDELEQRRGTPVVVNFWATWCDPCREEMPFIVDAAKAFDGEVEFLGVNVQDNADAAARFERDYGMTFDSVKDPDRAITNDQKLLGLPATQFYDADGELAYVKQGPIKEKELLSKIEDVIRASRRASR